MATTIGKPLTLGRGRVIEPAGERSPTGPSVQGELTGTFLYGTLRGRDTVITLLHQLRGAEAICGKSRQEKRRSTKGAGRRREGQQREKAGEEKGQQREQVGEGSTKGEGRRREGSTKGEGRRREGQQNVLGLT